MTTLEIDPETCVHRYEAHRSVRPTEQEEHCRSCSKEYELECPKYLSMSDWKRRNHEIPYRRGIGALIYG